MSEDTLIPKQDTSGEPIAAQEPAVTVNTDLIPVITHVEPPKEEAAPAAVSAPVVEERVEPENGEPMPEYIFWNPKGGFMSSMVHDEIPDDAIPLTADQYAALIAETQKGRCIKVGDDGVPYACDDHPNIFTAEEIQSFNKGCLDHRLLAASSKIGVLQDAVELDMATDEEKATLVAWKKYRVMLGRVDLTLEKPDWPEEPK